jgi:hypothetical protein
MISCTCTTAAISICIDALSVTLTVSIEYAVYWSSPVTKIQIVGCTWVIIRPKLHCVTLPPSLTLYGSTTLMELDHFFSFLSYAQSVEVLGRGISPSEGRYLYTEQHKHWINAGRHPCFEWDMNPRSQCSNGRRRFMRPLWSATPSLPPIIPLKLPPLHFSIPPNFPSCTSRRHGLKTRPV